MPISAVVRPSTVTAAGLVGGFAVAQRTGRRQLGGAVFAAAGAWCAARWWRRSGPATAIGLTALYAAAMGGSHPLAKKLGAWRSVAAVSTATAIVAEVVGRDRT